MGSNSEAMVVINGLIVLGVGCLIFFDGDEVGKEIVQSAGDALITRSDRTAIEVPALY